MASIEIVMDSITVDSEPSINNNTLLFQLYLSGSVEMICAPGLEAMNTCFRKTLTRWFPYLQPNGDHH